VRVHGEGEIIVTLGDSHYVMSGNTRGFSWSHVDPTTVERLDHSAAHYGSRQADGKPNTFSELFNRSTEIMDALRSNLANPENCWTAPKEDADALVAETASCDAYMQERLGEGWLPEEVKPLYTPTSEQMENPYWFTAMMRGPGKEHGSLHIKMPVSFFAKKERNYGHVSWAKDSRLWKLDVTKPYGEDPTEKVVRVKVLRPESTGVQTNVPLVNSQKDVEVPSGPNELTAFIDCLPEITKKCPLLYGPQTKLTDIQLKQLTMAMPEWALPCSKVDALAGVLKKPSEGTTTPAGFGGRFGVTGLHDEYNHTVSFFVYPQWARNVHAAHAAPNA